IWKACADNHIDRSACLIALGGGVTGDMCGFAAATWMRGVDFIQIPTSLLAMVDSSVGGKTGVNSIAGKNLIGAFKQPRTVIIDPQLMSTMQAREYNAGLAEVCKYGVIHDESFFSWQEDNCDALKNQDLEAVAYAVAESCRSKAWYVTEDEKEKGVRAHLNYGHTFGHALERQTEYKTYLHGEAVAIGMAMAAEFSHKVGLLTNPDLIQRQNTLLQKFDLPVSHKTSDISTLASTLCEHCLLDKKVSAGKTRFVAVQDFANIHMIKNPATSDVHHAFMQHISEC
ncbi:MAG: 3-dehydroquinate synthase, partial [Planctomycetes bacterium]|nr:3-dehydroquinate synthase [Planctomycetota bacterium]